MDPLFGYALPCYRGDRGSSSFIRLAICLRLKLPSTIGIRVCSNFPWNRATTTVPRLSIENERFLYRSVETNGTAIVQFYCLFSESSERCSRYAIVSDGSEHEGEGHAGFRFTPILLDSSLHRSDRGDLVHCGHGLFSSDSFQRMTTFVAL